MPAAPDPADVSDRPADADVADPADPAAPRPFAPTFFHGTRAALAPGDHVAPGYAPNFGARAHAAGWVYCSATLDAAVWGAELAAGDAPGRISVVEPTGPVEDDPELTDRKFPGNPTRSYRSRAALRVVGEVTGWRGHAPAALRAMRGTVARQTRDECQPPTGGVPGGAPGDH